MTERAKRAADELRRRGWQMDDDDVTSGALTKNCTRCGYGDMEQHFRFCPCCGQMVELHASAGTLEDIEAALVAAEKVPQ